MSGLLFSKHFQLQTLAEGVQAAIATDGGAAISNAGIVDLGGLTLIFDTTLTPQAALDLRQAAESATGRAARMVINSHYHNDHIWGNQVFLPGAQIVSSARTRQWIQTEGMQELRWYTENTARKLVAVRGQYLAAPDEQSRAEAALWLGYYEGLAEALPGLRVCLADITFSGQTEFHGELRSARLIEFEGGHTGSDSVLYLPQDGIVFMSDLLFVDCHPYLGDGDPLRLVEILKCIAELDASIYVPGHGPVGSKADVKLMIDYIESVQHSARSLVGEGKDYERELAEMHIPAAFQQWKLANFYPANLRYFCQSMTRDNGHFSGDA